MSMFQNTQDNQMSPVPDHIIDLMNSAIERDLGRTISKSILGTF